MQDLEAVWAEVMVENIRCVVGSVYIAPGDFHALDLLDLTVGRILQSHQHLLISMDANSRNYLWDNNCIGVSQYSNSFRMGCKLEDIINKHCLYIHNDGTPTYQSGNSVEWNFILWQSCMVSH